MNNGMKTMAEKDSDKKDKLEEAAERDSPGVDEPQKEVLEEEPARHHKHDHPGPERPMHGPAGDHYYSELARIVTTMFVGVLALMTFLLTVGLQRPHGTFRTALYSAIVILPLNLLMYMLGHLFADQAKQAKFNAEPGSKKLATARKRLVVVRFLQQLLFALAVLAVAWLAYAAAQFFFNLPANPAAGGMQ